MERRGASPYRTPALVRAAAALDRVAQDPDQTLTELVAELGLPRTTVFHLLRTLESLGLLRRAPSGRGYCLGTRLVELGSAALRQLDVREVARPHLWRLVERHGETAHLGILDAERRAVLCVEKVDSPQPVRVGLSVGATVPLHATASGKAALALLGGRFVDWYVEQAGLRRYTDTTIGDARALRAELRRVRALGYGFDQGEFHEGVSGIAGAVTDAGGGLAATVSVTAPASRLGARLRRQVARSVVETARAISTELGAPPDAG